ncbi:MAG: hypothetical protein WBM97_22340, partial [Sedimenticolaceae bacterium]
MRGEIFLTFCQLDDRGGGPAGGRKGGVREERHGNSLIARPKFETGQTMACILRKVTEMCRNGPTKRVEESDHDEPWCRN